MCVFLCCNPITSRWLDTALRRPATRSKFSGPQSSGASWFAKHLPGEKHLAIKTAAQPPRHEKA